MTEKGRKLLERLATHSETAIKMIHELDGHEGSYKRCQEDCGDEMELIDEVRKRFKLPVPEPEPCRPCSDCTPGPHHWIGNPNAFGPGDPDYACKHCEAESFMCAGNDNRHCENAVDKDGDLCTSCAGQAIQ